MADRIQPLFSVAFLLLSVFFLGSKAQQPQQNVEGQAPNYLPAPSNPCGSLSQKECDLQATAHNLYGFNLPYLSDAPASYPKYPSESWLDPECSISKCPNTVPHDPLAGLGNVTVSQWSQECQDVKAAVDCAAAMATKCLPDYFKDRKEFMVDTQQYYDTICNAADSYTKVTTLGQCSQAIMTSPTGAAFKTCHDNWLAGMHKSVMARGPNSASRWTSGTVNKDHCCQIKQRQSCFTNGNTQTICGSQAAQAIQSLFETTYSAFRCNDKLTQCPQ